MTKAFLRALLILSATAAVPVGLQAQSAAAERHEVALDIDQDGRMDRAVLTRNPANSQLDLSIELASEKPSDPAQEPTILKHDIAERLVLGFESRGKGSLVLITGCGGCSNDETTTLTIAYRNGQFVVAGITYDWDTRNGAGTCDINFLTGQGTLSRNRGKAKPLPGRLRLVKLADWSDDMRRTACGF